MQSYFRLDAPDVLERMQRAVTAANRAVHEKGRQNPEFSDMGTTCSALSLSERGAIIAMWETVESTLFVVDRSHS